MFNPQLAPPRGSPRHKQPYVAPSQAEVYSCIKELALCDLSFKYFVLKYGWTRDDYEKIGEKTKRYPNFKYLHGMMEEIDKGGNILMEKSRQMLATWTLMLYFLHCILFRDWSCFVTSRREDIVDDGGEESTYNSLMGKIRFAYDRLPEWMKEEKGPLTFSKMKIINRRTGTIIIGETANANCGRSGTFTVKLIDEFTFIDLDEEVLSSMTGGSDHRTFIIVSTPNKERGMRCAFARLRYDPNSGFRVLSYPWRLRPDRDVGWYRKQGESMTQAQIAAELDISYFGASEERMFPSFREKHIVPYDKVPFEELGYIAGVDWGYGASGCIVIVGVRGKDHYVVDEVHESQLQILRVPGGVMADCWIMRALGLQHEYGVETFICGHDRPGDIEAFNDYGLNAIAWDKKGKDAYVDGVRTINRLLESDTLFVSDRCVNVISEWKQARWKIDREGRRLDEPQKMKDDAADAARYGISGAEEYLVVTEESAIDELPW